MHNNSKIADAVQAFGRVLAAETNPAKRAAYVKQAEMVGMNNASAESLDLGKFASPARASEQEKVNIRWLWKGLLPLGAYSGIYGTEGDGKSVFTVWLAAQATLGKLPGHLEGEPTCVEFVAYEDDYAAVVTPRLIAAGADLDRCFFHGGDLGDEPLILPDDVEKLGAAMLSRGSKLVIVDPVVDAMREGLKDNNNADVRKALVPLGKMAEKVGAIALGVMHPNKGHVDAANKVMGAKAWRTVPRSVLRYGRDPDSLDGDTRILAVAKANYARRTSRKFKVGEVAVDGYDELYPKAQEIGASEYTDQDIILAEIGATKPAKAVTQQTAAEKLTLRLLSDGGGEIEAATAYAAGEAAGISPETMRRARRNLGVAGGKTWTFADDRLPV